MLIKYEVKGTDECITKCPARKRNVLNNIIRVGSMVCVACDCFVKDTTGNNEIECKCSEPYSRQYTPMCLSFTP